MVETTSGTLKRTPLHDRHVALGARMTAFAGWQMPLEYSGIVDEHLAVRTRAGLFDVSHMGEIEVAGSDALAALEELTCNAVARLQVGQAQYTVLTTPAGTVVDDLVLYRLHADHFLLVVNAVNTGKDVSWIVEHSRTVGEVIVIDASARYALLALQGPAAAELLQPLTGVDLASLRWFRFVSGEVAGIRATIARTGYTGEDGFELFLPPSGAARVWDALLDVGRAVDLRPAGLGARDTLRLEAGLRLYGYDIDETTTLLEAGLEQVVAWEKGAFVGRSVLEAERAGGPRRRLVGFEMMDRAIARHGYAVYAGGTRVGTVTSGTYAPFLRKAIGLTYLPVEQAREGVEIEVDVRGRRARAKVVPLPFYRRRKR
jgi:aminomethyltransferase